MTCRSKIPESQDKGNSPAMRMSVVLILYSYLKLKSNYKLHIKV